MISVPAIFNFGDAHMRNTVGRELLLGEKSSCLAISEPFAGSDVAGLRTTATKSPDGKHYIVNGVKKWITEGAYADYFVVAVRTGGDKGAGGISMLLIERSEGVETRQIKTTYAAFGPQCSSMRPLLHSRVLFWGLGVVSVPRFHFLCVVFHANAVNCCEFCSS